MKKSLLKLFSLGCFVMFLLCIPFSAEAAIQSHTVSNGATYTVNVGDTLMLSSYTMKSISKSKKSYTIKNLKAKKKYYVRIRAYKKYTVPYTFFTVKTKKAYGKWVTLSKKTK